MYGSRSKKEHLYPVDKKIRLSEKYYIYLLHSIGYTKNVSLRRFIDHVCVARKFDKYAREEPLPDIIVASLPTLDLSAKSVQFGDKHSIPVIVDLRDMWPDILLSRAPTILRGLLKRAVAGAPSEVPVTPTAPHMNTSVEPSGVSFRITWLPVSAT